MVALIIFWSAAFSLLFFLLGIIFRTLSSAFDSLVESFLRLLSIVVIAGEVVGISYLVYSIIDGIIKNGVSDVILEIVCVVIALGIICAFIGGLWQLFMNLIINIFNLIVFCVSVVFERMAFLFESLCEKCVNVLIRRTDKC